MVQDDEEDIRDAANELDVDVNGVDDSGNVAAPSDEYAEDDAEAADDYSDTDLIVDVNADNFDNE